MNAIRIFIHVVAWLILLISTLGNFTLIIALIKHYRKSSSGYICLMFNLAVADLLLVFSSIPFTFVEELQNPVFPFSAPLCKLLWPFQTSMAMTSIFTVAALSCQRYLMIVRPSMNYQKGNAVTTSFVLTILWALPIITAALPLAFSLELDDKKICAERWSDRYKRYFTVYLTSIQYVLPLGVITWCNGRAVIVLKKHDIYRANFAILNASLVTRNRNVVRMLVCIVVVFAIFWLPGQLSWLVETFSEHSDKWNTLKEVSSLFIFANSAFNPLIFFYYNDEYRIKGFSVLFKDARKVTSPCHKRSARNCKRISFGPVQMLSNV